MNRWELVTFDYNGRVYSNYKINTKQQLSKSIKNLSYKRKDFAIKDFKNKKFLRWVKGIYIGAYNLK